MQNVILYHLEKIPTKTMSFLLKLTKQVPHKLIQLKWQHMTTTRFMTSNKYMLMHQTLLQVSKTKEITKTMMIMLLTTTITTTIKPTISNNNTRKIMIKITNKMLIINSKIQTTTTITTMTLNWKTINLITITNMLKITTIIRRPNSSNNNSNTISSLRNMYMSQPSQRNNQFKSRSKSKKQLL